MRKRLFLFLALFSVALSAQEKKPLPEKQKKTEAEKKTIPVKYDYTGDFREGLAAVKLNGKYGFINKSGNVVIPLKYDNV